MEGFGAHYAVVLHRQELQRTAAPATPRRSGIRLRRLGWPARFSRGRTTTATRRLALAEVSVGLADTPIFRQLPSWVS